MQHTPVTHTLQEARVKCANAWANAGALSHDKKVALLKEYLVMLFHTVMPPDVRFTLLPPTQRLPI